MKLNAIADTLHLWRKQKIKDKNFILILAIFVGIAVGIAAVIMKNTVHFVREIVVLMVDKYDFNYIYFIFPVIGILLTLIFVNFFVKDNLGHGIPMVLYNMSKNEGKIKKHNMFSRIVASSLTIGFGGSVGLEGPIVATGAAIGSNIGQFFKLNYKQIILLIGCASTGAIAAIFKAPIAGVIFAIEVIMLDLTMASLLPLLLASISAALTSYMFLGQNYIYFVENTDPFFLRDVPFYILIGILSGLFSVYFSKIYLWQTRLYKSIQSKYTKFFIGTLVLGTLIFLFPSLYGEGYEAVNIALKGDTSFLFSGSIYPGWNSFLGLTVILGCILFLKIFATSATFGAGGVGGIFAPSLFLGTTLGLFFSNIVNSLGFKISTSNFALVGMAGMLSGIIHAPLTAIFLIAEITGGYNLFVPLMIVSALSYFTVKLFMPNSVYTIILAKRGHLLTHNADSNMLTLMKTESLIEKNFLTITENASLGELTKVISKSSRTIYVVVDEDNNLKGLVWLDHVKHLMFKKELYETTLVKDLMYIPDPILTTDMSVREIADIFEKTDHYNLPVVENGKYVGFVSRAKVFSTYRELLKNFSND